ncbi:unnamed protein product, partial [Rotaria sp. Silwood2]
FNIRCKLKFIERLDTRDLLSYGQLSYDTILTSIQSITKLPLKSLFSRHSLDLTSSLEILIELYVRSFIYLSDILLGQTTKEYNQFSSIISSSDNILIELVAELYQRTKQSSTLSYEALLLLRSLPLLLVHIGLLDRLMNKMVF